MPFLDELSTSLNTFSTLAVFKSAQRQVRQKLMSGASLAEVVDTIIYTLQEAYPDILASVLLLDHANGKLRQLSAPSLPEAYSRAIDGLTIGPMVGCCGSAAYSKERVVVESIATDPRWANFQIALEHGLRACWSQPIASSQDDTILGTFALYYKGERRPSEEEILLLETAADLAGTAIEWEQVIAQRKTLERELQESNASLRFLNAELENKISERTAELGKQHYLTKTITDNATGALFMMDATGYCTFMNPAAVEMVGYTLEEIREKPLHYMIHHHHPDGSFYPLEECPIDRALPQNFDVRAHEDVFIHKDGTYFPVLCAASPIFDENGVPVSTVIEVRNITEEKKNQQELIDSAARMQTLLSAMPQIAFTATVEGELDYVNGNWREYTGMPKAEVLGEEWMNALHPDDRKRAELAWMHSIETGDDYEIEFRVRHRTGNYRWYLARAIALRNEEGQILKWFGTATDIHEQKLLIDRLAATQQELQLSNTELSQKNSELERTNADLDNFIYAASHDLKAPIANLEGLVAALQEELREPTHEPKAIEPLLEMMVKSIVRFRTTINELTEISKVQKQVDKPHEQVEIGALLEEFKQENARLISKFKARIHTDFSEVGTLCFSRKNLRSVLYNLITNAIKYHHPERTPEVKIGTSWYGDNGVLLTVEDNGLGIEERHQEQIFGMFKRVHQHVEGSGVGLYIVKRIIENAGGEIAVKSKVGEGTRFEIRLPNGALCEAF